MADLTHEATDQELIELFSAFDDVVASEKLKSSTLDAIFAQLEAEEAGDGAGIQATPQEEQATMPVESASDARPVFSVVETADPIARTDGHTGEPTTPELSVVDRNGKVIRRGVIRRRGMRLRVAAAVVAVSIVAAGGVAYAVPASHVQVTEGGTTIDLGVNVFGRTVTAEATTDEGREVLDGLDLYHRGFDDALGRVIDRMGERGEGDGSVNVQVESPFDAQRNGLDTEAARVIDGRGFERGEGARGPSSSTAPAVESPAMTSGGGMGGMTTETTPTAASPGGTGRVGTGANGRNSLPTTTDATAQPTPTAPTTNGADGQATQVMGGEATAATGDGGATGSDPGMPSGGTVDHDGDAGAREFTGQPNQEMGSVAQSDEPIDSDAPDQDWGSAETGDDNSGVSGQTAPHAEQASHSALSPR